MTAKTLPLPDPDENRFGPKGLLFARFAKSKAIGRHSEAAAAFADSQTWLGRQIIVAAHKAGAATTANQNELAAPIATDFAQAVAPLTVIGRLPGVRKVPMNVRIATSLDTATAFWLGDQDLLPVTLDQLRGEMFRALPVVAIAMLTNELISAAGSVAELAMSASLLSATARAIDRAFLDPTNAGTDGRPAALVAGATPIVCTGLTPAAVDTALQAAIAALVAAGSDLGPAVWITSTQTATRLAGLRGTGGAPAYPAVTAKGGELLGLPVLTSRFMSNGQIQLIDCAAVAVGDEGKSTLEISKSTALKILSDNGTSSMLVSMFQSETSAMKAVRHLFWKLTVPGRAQLITGIGAA